MIGPQPAQTTPHLVWLDGSPVGRSLVGGKGTSLSQLAGFGAPVPPAFALTTWAYAEFANVLGLPRRASDAAEPDLPGLRETIAQAPLPSAVAEAIGQGFRAFQERLAGDLALAVRSSATAEDSISCSFAGLHDTVLDVRTLPALEAAVRQCWASLWSGRAFAYRHAGGLAADDAEIAVVVQQMVRSDVSFVVFTADPVSGDRERLVIAANYGLGEAIVSGRVTPDHIVVGPGGLVDEYTIGAKEIMLIPGASADEGPREVSTPRALRAAPALTHEQAATVAALARDLAARLGYDADLEGAFSAAALHLFQARPITTLAPPASGKDSAQRFIATLTAAR